MEMELSLKRILIILYLIFFVSLYTASARLLSKGYINLNGISDVSMYTTYQSNADITYSI